MLTKPGLCISFLTRETLNSDVYSAVNPLERKGYLYGSVMALLMGIVGVMRLTKNMPRKLTEANVYSREGGSVYQDGVTVMSKQEYMAMVKKMTDLEEKCKFMEAQAAFSLEREKILDAALRRVDQLELHLSETKKVKLSLSFTSLLICLLCFV